MDDMFNCMGLAHCLSTCTPPTADDSALALDRLSGDPESSGTTHSYEPQSPPDDGGFGLATTRRGGGPASVPTTPIPSIPSGTPPSPRPARPVLWIQYDRGRSALTASQQAVVRTDLRRVLTAALANGASHVYSTGGASTEMRSSSPTRAQQLNRDLAETRANHVHALVEAVLLGRASNHVRAAGLTLPDGTQASTTATDTTRDYSAWSPTERAWAISLGANPNALRGVIVSVN